MVPILAAVALSILTTTTSNPPPDSLRVEARRTNDALVRDGFNFTRRVRLAGAGASERFELFFPPGEARHRVGMWGAAPGGRVELRLVSPRGGTVLAWSTSGIALDTTLAMPPGACTAEIARVHADSGYAVLGIKGPVLMRCDSDEARVSRHEANPKAGFSWPYLLYLPDRARSTYLLVAPNNTGFATTDGEVLGVSATCAMAQLEPIADRMLTPALIPLFPRPPIDGGRSNLYLHALTRASLTTKAARYRRVDLQLVAMIDDATAWLRARNVYVNPDVLIAGFSASGSFASRFAMLHPDRVLAVAAGSPGGWPIAPESHIEGEPIPYPVGTADLATLTGASPDPGALRSVSWFFFMGDRDENDAVPFRDSFSAADEEQIDRLFGRTPVARWRMAENLYRTAGLNATFRLYPGVGHQVTGEMQTDIEAFFLKVAKEDGP